MRKLLLLPVLALGIAAAAPASATDFTARITATGFPPLVKVQNGDRVTWKNDDKINRQVVADDNSWKSPVLKPGQTWSRLFLTGGTFKYHGVVKPAQHGMVVVTATRSIDLQPVVNTTTFSHAVQLNGSVSDQTSSGEQVTIQAQPRGRVRWTQVARTTTQGGDWNVLVRPSRTTVYRAVWNNVTSPEQTINVRPLLRIKQVRASRLFVSAHADVRLLNHTVLIQRLNKRRHVWRTFAHVRLRSVQSTVSTSYRTIGTVRLRLRRGMIIRAFMTNLQAGPYMSGPAWSRSIHI